MEIPRGLVKDAWLNFWTALWFCLRTSPGNHKTVVRGGFGAMYERIQGNDVYNAGPNIPFSSSVTFNDVSINNPKQSLITGATLAAPITVASITGLSKTDYKPPVSYQYSIGVEHEIAPNSVLNVSYVGNQNRHQNDYRNINLPNQRHPAKFDQPQAAIPPITRTCSTTQWFLTRASARLRKPKPRQWPLQRLAGKSHLSNQTRPHLERRLYLVEGN